MKSRWLMITLRWVAAGLVLRVLAALISNYPDYFPPNFNSLFLEGREKTFIGIYRPAFYIHILSAPLVLGCGLILLSDYVRCRYATVHRNLGKVHVAVLLLLVLPSSIIMCQHAFGGWPAGLSFLLLSLLTAICAVVGVIHARHGQYQSHRQWMQRCYVLICSAVTLRLFSGAAGLIGVPNPETAYIIAAWISWLVPLAAFEVVTLWLRGRWTQIAHQRLATHHPFSSSVLALRGLFLIRTRG